MLQSKFELISQNVSLRVPAYTAPLTISISAVPSRRPETVRPVREDSFWINLIKVCLTMFADVGGSQCEADQDSRCLEALFDLPLASQCSAHSAQTAEQARRRLQHCL